MDVRPLLIHDMTNNNDDVDALAATSCVSKAADGAHRRVGFGGCTRSQNAWQQMMSKGLHQYGAVQPPFTFDQKHGAMQSGIDQH